MDFFVKVLKITVRVWRVLPLFNFAVENVGRASNSLNIKTADFSNGIEY